MVKFPLFTKWKTRLRAFIRGFIANSAQPRRGKTSLGELWFGCLGDRLNAACEAGLQEQLAGQNGSAAPQGVESVLRRRK